MEAGWTSGKAGTAAAGGAAKVAISADVLAKAR